MKLDTRWLDWQSSSEKFQKSAEGEPSKITKTISEISDGADSIQNQNFFDLEATPEAYEEAFSRWIEERCMFLDRAWWYIGALHRDYFAWCERTGADVPCSRNTLTILLRDSGFTITDDGLVYGLALTEDFRKSAEQEVPKITKKTGRRQ